MSKEQCLQGLFFQYLLDHEELKGSNIVINALSEVVEIQIRNHHINTEINKFFKFLRNSNIECLMVKGQIAAQWYPAPEVRIPGDVDFIIWNGDTNSAEELIRKSFNVELNLDKFEKHSVFFTNDVLFELHHELLQFYYPQYSNYWNSILEKEDAVNIKVGEMGVLTYSPTTNVLYTFIHMFLHLLSSGVSIRHFCDWMMCIHYYHDKIDYNLLQRHLQHFGLMKAYLSAGSIIVDYLGLSKEEFRFNIPDSNRRCGRRILADTIKMGNFGRNLSPMANSGLSHSFQTGCRLMSQSLKYFHLFPKEIMLKFPCMVLSYIWERKSSIICE